MDMPALPLSDDFTLKDLLCVFWQGRGHIALTAIGLALVAWAPVYLVPKTFTARTLIAIVPSDMRQSGLGSSTSKVSGLAAAMGLSPEALVAHDEALGTLRSDLLMQEYIRSQHLIPLLTRDKAPTLLEASKSFARVRGIAEDPKTGIITVAAKWGDPRVAAKWANDLVALANDDMRERSMREHNADIDFLRAQSESTTSAEMKKEISILLQSAIQSEMMAETRHEYAFKVLDPAIPPEKPTSPVPLLWALGGFTGGMLISMSTLSIRSRTVPTAKTTRSS
jgi:uncharacterized protein involved in exopolysaccharide biosynthesis